MTYHTVCYVFLELFDLNQSYINVKETHNSEIMGYFITGYVEGEGCFSLATYKDKRYSNKIQFMPSFTIQVHIIDMPLIKKIKSTLQCGRIYYNKRDNTVNYKVYKINDLITKVIPFFDKYQFQGNKKKSFDIFKKIMKLIKNHENQTDEQIALLFYLKKIMNDRKEELNDG